MTVTSGGIFALAPHVRLQWDRRRERWFLQAPERIYVLDDVGAAILKRCDGTASVGGVVAALGQEYDAVPAQLAADVEEFLAALAEAGLVVHAG